MIPLLDKLLENQQNSVHQLSLQKQMIFIKLHEIYLRKQHYFGFLLIKELLEV